MDSTLRFQTCNDYGPNESVLSYTGSLGTQTLSQWATPAAPTIGRRMSSTDGLFNKQTLHFPGPGTYDLPSPDAISSRPCSPQHSFISERNTPNRRGRPLHAAHTARSPGSTPGPSSYRLTKANVESEPRWSFPKQRMPDIYDRPKWKSNMPHSHERVVTHTSKHRAPRTVFPTTKRMVEPRVWSQASATALVW